MTVRCEAHSYFLGFFIALYPYFLLMVIKLLKKFSLIDMQNITNLGIRISFDIQRILLWRTLIQCVQVSLFTNFLKVHVYIFGQNFFLQVASHVGNNFPVLSQLSNYVRTYKSNYNNLAGRSYVPQRNSQTVVCRHIVFWTCLIQYISVIVTLFF